jgi:hypothetical protein
MTSASTSFRLLSPPRIKAAAWVVVAVVAGFYLVLPILMGRLAGDLRHALWSYNGASIALSYADTGFARRELEGTLIRLFTPEPMAGGLAFHLIACGVLVALAAFATLKAALPERNRLAIAAVLLAVLAIVAVDVGRADPAILACGVIAAWGARTGRWIVAAAALSVALAFHEAGFIVLVPMVACIAWDHRSWRDGGGASLIGGLLVVGAGLVAYALALGAHPDVQAVGRRIHAEFADPKLADLSVYYTLSGLRGLASILCQQRLDGEYLSKIVKGAALIALLAFALRPQRRLTTLFAALAPFLFLSAIALDLGRWAALAAFVVAAMAVMDGHGRGGTEVPPLPGANLLLAVAAALLLMIRPQVIDLGDPLPIIPNFLYGHGSRTFSPLDAAARCDPGWKPFIGLTT